jgi:hypothetical protein
MVNGFSFSYTPKPSTALASITPLKLLGEGRGALRFTASTPMSFIKQNPEIVTEGFWKGRQALTEGIVKGATSALSGVAGALTQKAADAKATTDAELAHTRAKEIANIKAAPTFNEELYKTNQLAIQNEQLRKLQTENNNVDTPQDDSVAEGDTSVIDQLESLITPAVEKVNSKTPTQPVDTTGTTAPTGTPTGTTYAPNPQTPAQNAIIALQKSQQESDNARRQLSQSAATSVKFETEKALKENNFDELDRLANLGAIDQNLLVQYKTFANSAKRSSDRLAKLQPPDTNTLVAENTPVSTPESAPDRTIFGQSNNPNFVPLRDALKNRGVVSEMPTQFSEQSVAPSENLSFLDINSITPEQTQSIRGEGYQLPVVEPSSPKVEMPEVKEQLVLNGVSLPLAQVTGAEGKNPLAAVEPVLPTQVPSEPAPATTAELTPERTQEQIVNEYVGLLTNKPYRGAGDARRAKQVLEKLGLKAEIEVEKGEKGSRLHYVKVVEEAPPAKTAPEGYFVESIRDADGKETYVYKPKIPVKQQIATFDSNIEKAKVLQETLTKIKEIAPGYLFAGAGGISGLMKYNPIANDARTTRSLLDTVKGIVGFDELVALKAQGGSLGALSDSELKMLTSLKGSIDPDMDEATFLANINKMSESTEKLITGLEADKKEVMKVESPTKFQPIQTPENRVEVKTQEEYNALKKGQKWIWNGQTGTKN